MLYEVLDVLILMQAVSDLLAHKLKDFLINIKLQINIYIISRLFCLRNWVYSFNTFIKSHTAALK